MIDEILLPRGDEETMKAPTTVLGAGGMEGTKAEGKQSGTWSNGKEAHQFMGGEKNGIFFSVNFLMGIK